LTRRYTEEAIRFIEENRGRPFFLFLSHAMPGSTPHPFASDPFKGKSKNGPYGDSVEEIDWSTGEILQTLERLGLEDNTLIIFTSDNGAPRRDPPQGSNKPLAGWGYTVAEGGMRVPFLARWPGQIPPGVTSDYLATSMDLLPTFAELAGGSGPQDRMIDGKNIWSILTNEATGSPHEAFYYYYMDQLRAVRSGKWKLYLQLDQEDVVGQEVDASQPRLFDLSTDLTESRDVAAENRAVVDRLIRLAERARDDLGDRGRHGKNQRPAGWVAQPLPQVRK
ncbi:MAG TPA: sulfatase-like hydrolase/transferase, partial [Acidobacteriota bacterium]|nr:sulfatase-like hydrolase/transferase [Acidobacteriota bacterium]